MLILRLYEAGSATKGLNICIGEKYQPTSVCVLIWVEIFATLKFSVP